MTSSGRWPMSWMGLEGWSQNARTNYYETRSRSDLEKTLKERIEALLAEAYSLEN